MSMFNLWQSDSEELDDAIKARDAEIADLQEQVRAWQEADQRDFLNDNSDQLGRIIQAKNVVIQELQNQLVAQGKECVAQAVDSAAVSASELERLRCTVSELQLQLDTRDEHLLVAVKERNELRAKLEDPSALELSVSRLEELEHKLQLCHAENDRLTQQASRGCMENGWQQEKAELEEKVGALTATMDQLVERIETANKERSAQRQKASAYKAQLAEVQSTLSSKEERITALTVESDRLKQALETRWADAAKMVSASVHENVVAQEPSRFVSRGKGDPLDLELGGGGVGVSELLIGDLPGLTLLDSKCQQLTELMTARADVRLAFFGLWAVCHFLYVSYLVYMHFLA
jgi:chromosome segregation ATPase